MKRLDGIYKHYNYSVMSRAKFTNIVITLDAARKDTTKITKFLSIKYDNRPKVHL